MVGDADTNSSNSKSSSSSSPHSNTNVKYDNAIEICEEYDDIETNLDQPKQRKKLIKYTS